MKSPPVSLLNSIARDLYAMQEAGLSLEEAEAEIMARYFGAGPARRQVVVAMEDPIQTRPVAVTRQPVDSQAGGMTPRGERNTVNRYRNRKGTRHENQ